MESPNREDAASPLDIRTRMRLERWVTVALMLAAGAAMAAVVLAARFEVLQRIGIGAGP